MARSVKLRDDSNSSAHSIADQVTGLLSRIGLFGRKGSVLGYFWVRVEDEREGVLVDYVPVKDIEFVVHHCVNSFVEQVHRQKVSWSVDHESTVWEGRLVLDSQGQSGENALLVLHFGTVDRLHEGLQTPHKSYKSLSFDSALLRLNDQRVALFGSRKGTCQLSINYLYLNFMDESFGLNIKSRVDDYIGHIAVKSFVHLKVNKLSNMLITILFCFYVKENSAWITQSYIFLTTLYLLRHRKEVHSLTPWRRYRWYRLRNSYA